MADPKGKLVTVVGFDPDGLPRALEVDANDYLKVALAAWLEGAVDVKGYDGAVWRPLLVDTSGRAIVVGTGTSSEIPVSLAAPARGLVGEHGWIGGAWQKNPLLLGYSAAIRERVSNTNAAAGFNALNGTAVPAGEIWVVQTVSAFDVNSAVTSLRIYVDMGTIFPIMVDVGARAANLALSWTGAQVMAAGDKLSAQFFGCTAGDDLYLDYAGYRVDIDQ